MKTLEACAFHHQTMSQFHCHSCQQSLCQRCIRRLPAGRIETYSCRHCQGMATMLELEPVAAMPDAAPFWAHFVDALRYPLRGNGPALLITGALFFAALDFLSQAPLVGLLVVIASAGYLCAFMFSVTASSANGDSDMPDWPNFYGFWDTVLTPLFRYILTLAVSLAPLWIGHIVTGGTLSLFWGLALTALGLCYFPMALLGTALNTSIPFMPPVALRSIARIWPQYLVACAGLALLVTLSIVTQMALIDALPWIGGLVGGLASLYFLVVEMRIIGLLYHLNEDKLDWF